MTRTMQITTEPGKFPEDTIFAGIRFTLTMGGSPPVVPEVVLQAPYDFQIPADLAPGDYMLIAQAMDSIHSTPLGDPVTTTFTVAPAVMVDIPKSLAVVMA